LKVLIQCLPEFPDVIAITEFKPKKTAHQLLIREFNLDGYNVFHSELDNNNDRGVLFYIAQGIQASPVDIPSALNEFLFFILKIKDLQIAPYFLEIFIEAQVVQLQIIMNCAVC